LAPGPFVPPWVDERMKKLEAVLAG
jgi:hypothetical protein